MIVNGIALFDLYCYTEELHMKPDEFKFMVEKFITIISQTLSIKRSYLNEVYKDMEFKLLPAGKDKITKNEFMKILDILSKDACMQVD